MAVYRGLSRQKRERSRKPLAYANGRKTVAPVRGLNTQSPAAPAGESGNSQHSTGLFVACLKVESHCLGFREPDRQGWKRLTDRQRTRPEIEYGLASIRKARGRGKVSGSRWLGIRPNGGLLLIRSIGGAVTSGVDCSVMRARFAWRNKGDGNHSRFSSVPRERSKTTRGRKGRRRTPS
jgi:hypothetical protein